jgi:undecaprenyl diphosphate synthase
MTKKVSLFDRLFRKHKAHNLQELHIPKHIAFIMDGNGRWAKKQSLPRHFGHARGAEVFRKLVRYCGDIGIEHVTVYAFSTENWKRPKEEVDAIMKLLSSFIDEACRDIAKEKFRVVFLGNKNAFEDEMRIRMEKLEAESAVYTRILNVALNYGGRDEIVTACNKLIAEGARNITEELISSHLYTKLSPDPDLIVRTAGEYRTSNFLLWQSAYSEFYFTDKLWPDMTPADVDLAIASYSKRERRFGAVTGK